MIRTSKRIIVDDKTKFELVLFLYEKHFNVEVEKRGRAYYANNEPIAYSTMLIEVEKLYDIQTIKMLTYKPKLGTGAKIWL